MLAEWSAECAADDSILVVPWQDAGGMTGFVDLRSSPRDFDAVAEAEQHPPLMQALRSLNMAHSPVFTAKCDAWPMDAEELHHLHSALDVRTGDAPAGFASYIDLIWRHHTLFSSCHQQQQKLRSLTRLAAPLDRPSAALDCVLRPAFLDLEEPREGFAVTLYVKALGHSPQSAYKEWAAALAAVVALIRGKDFAR